MYSLYRIALQLHCLEVVLAKQWRKVMEYQYNIVAIQKVSSQKIIVNLLMMLYSIIYMYCIVLYCIV